MAERNWVWDGHAWVESIPPGTGISIASVIGLQAALDQRPAMGSAFNAAVLNVIAAFQVAAVIFEVSGTYTVPAGLPSAFTRVYVGLTDATALPGFRSNDLYLKELT